ncbi:MAG: nucleotidyltransferase family protein, partial [Clostridia bacterium]
MKLMAVICEYNPFHNGHAYQLAQQKESLGCDGVICLMSGSFVQRGEPALCDKWARSEMALSGGCDLVLELPVVYSLQSAEGFAR